MMPQTVGMVSDGDDDDQLKRQVTPGKKAPAKKKPVAKKKFGKDIMAAYPPPGAAPAGPMGRC